MTPSTAPASRCSQEAAGEDYLRIMERSIDPNVFETANAGFAQALYEEYLRDPGSVAPEWRHLFESGRVGEAPAANGRVINVATGGRISLNWRLIQTPDAVRDYVLIHELMHLRQPNHSARFWALVARACPDHEASRRWLRAHEAALLDAR